MRREPVTVPHRQRLDGNVPDMIEEFPSSGNISVGFSRDHHILTRRMVPDLEIFPYCRKGVMLLPQICEHYFRSFAA